MKKKLFKLLSVLFSAIIIFTSCSNNNQKLFPEEPEFVIEDADYVLKIEIIGAFCKHNYTFILTPENTLLSQYNEFCDESGRFEQAKTSLNEWQLSMIEYYLAETKKDIIEKDTEDCCIVTDLMYERMYIGDELIMFTYGASESTPANLLTELIIGCSDLKILKFDDYELKPTGAIYRKMMEDFVEIDKRQE